MDDVISTSPDSTVSHNSRQDVNEWCSCENCTNMDRHRERVCCHDIHECQEKCDDSIINYEQEQPYDCITYHPGFAAVCLNFEVLDVAWYGYKQQYGADGYENANVHRRRRHIAYRQLARFLFHILGRTNRYVLPSCAVHAIREAFPSQEAEPYVGFRYADE